MHLLIFYTLNFFHFLLRAKQMITPPNAITAQREIVDTHPKVSEKTAKPQVEIALPTQVQEFKIPETKENIKRISIYMADQQVSAVVRSKISKRKIALRDEVSSEMEVQAL